MRYHYSKPDFCVPIYGKEYACDHPLYSCCTLFTIKDKGIAVIQQRFDEASKRTFWSNLDKDVANAIYLNRNFYEFFKEHSSEASEKGLYPTFTVRHVMWALRIKPLKKEAWETVFDRTRI